MTTTEWVLVANIVGTVSIFLLFVMKFFIAINNHLFRKSGRVAILWTTIYVFFLFMLGLVRLLNIASQDELRIISGFTSVIPLIGVATHLFLNKKIEEDDNRL